MNKDYDVFIKCNHPSCSRYSHIHCMLNPKNYENNFFLYPSRKCFCMIHDPNILLYRKRMKLLTLCNKFQSQLDQVINFIDKDKNHNTGIIIKV